MWIGPIIIYYPLEITLFINFMSVLLKEFLSTNSIQALNSTPSENISWFLGI